MRIGPITLDGHQMYLAPVRLAHTPAWQRSTSLTHTGRMTPGVWPCMTAKRDPPTASSPHRETRQRGTS